MFTARQHQVWLTLRRVAGFRLNLGLHLAPEAIGIRETMLNLSQFSLLQISVVFLARQRINDVWLRIALPIRALIAEQVIDQPRGRLPQDVVRVDERIAHVSNDDLIVRFSLEAAQ